MSVSQYTGHIIRTETCDNNTALPLVGVLVTCSGRINDNMSKLKFLRHLWEIVVFRLVVYLLNLINTLNLIQNLTDIHFGIILTQFYINFLRQKHQIELLYVSINPWDSQVSAYAPFHFSFTVTLKKAKCLETWKLLLLLFYQTLSLTENIDKNEQKKTSKKWTKLNEKQIKKRMKNERKMNEKRTKNKWKTTKKLAKNERKMNKEQTKNEPTESTSLADFIFN